MNDDINSFSSSCQGWIFSLTANAFSVMAYYVILTNVLKSWYLTKTEYDNSFSSSHIELPSLLFSNITGTTILI